MFLQGDSARAPLNCRFSFSSFRAHSWIAPQERFLPHQGYTFFLVSIKRSDNLTSVWDISGPEFHLCPIKPLLQPSNSSPPTLSKPTPFPLSQIMVAYSTTCLRISILAPTSGQNQTLISISFPKTCPKFSTFFWLLHTKVQRLFFIIILSYSYSLKNTWSSAHAIWHSIFRVHLYFLKMIISSEANIPSD